MFAHDFVLMFQPKINKMKKRISKKIDVPTVPTFLCLSLFCSYFREQSENAL